MQLVAESTLALLAMPRGFVIEPNRFARACLSRLIDQRLAAPNGRLRPKLIGPELAGFLGGFVALPERDAICVGDSAALYSLRRLLQSGERFQHPLRCILTALWLFGTWREFMVTYMSITDLPFPTADVSSSVALDAARKPGRVEQDEQAFLHLVCDQGLTIRSATKMVGIDVQTGLNWAARARILIRRRPKKLDPAARKRVISALRRGASKQSAADLADISIVTVTRILCSEPGLRDAWRQMSDSHHLASARSQLLRAVNARPGAGIKEVRSSAPAAYAWLYRNDRAWLDTQVTTLPRKVRGNHSSVDWDARDAAFARAVDVTRQALSASLVSAHLIRAVQLARLVPGLRSKLRHLDRMPLTRAALGTS
jgi:transposase